VKIYGLQQPSSRLKGKVCSLAYELVATWHQPTFIQVTRVNSCNDFAMIALQTSSWYYLPNWLYFHENVYFILTTIYNDWFTDLAKSGTWYSIKQDTKGVSKNDWRLAATCCAKQWKDHQNRDHNQLQPVATYDPSTNSETIHINTQRINCGAYGWQYEHAAPEKNERISFASDHVDPYHKKITKKKNCNNIEQNAHKTRESKPKN